MRTRAIAAIGVLILAVTAVRAQSRTDDLAAAGWRAIDAQDAEKAEDLFRQALSQRPRDAALQLGAGVAAHLQGHDDEATRFLKQSLALEPRMTGASQLLGEIAYSEGDLDLAIKTYESALALSPRNGSALKERLTAWRNEAAVHDSLSTVKDDRFSVKFDGPVEQKLAVHATTVLGNAFWTIGKTIGAYPNRPINVVFYSDQQFRDITGAPEWAGGGFDGQIRVPVRGALARPQLLDRVLVHELTHAMLQQVAGHSVPVWLHEGLATYFEGEDAAAAERELQRVRLYVPLTKLRGSFTGLTTAQAGIAYTESLFAASALIERVGAAGVAQLLQDISGGEPIESAVQRFGFTFDQFERTLIDRIGRR